MNHYICEECGQKFCGWATGIICQKCGGILKEINREEFLFREKKSSHRGGGLKNEG
ncbi:hypothetical protein ES705_07502 [subsurface metagenome]|nr:hypothetical protein [Clostridia bacterium]